MDKEEREVKEKEKEGEKAWKEEGKGWLVHSAPGKGRGVFREKGGKGKRVGRGDLIHEELPLCCVLNDELVSNHCDGCFKEGESLLRCAGCKVTYYCSRACQKKGWAAHKFECKCLKAAAPNKPTRSMRLMFRFMGEVTTKGDKTTHLLSHRANLSAETLSNITHLAIGTHNVISKVLKKGEEEEKERDEEVQKMTERFCMFMSNCLVMSDGEMREVGVGLFVGLAMVNHSCAPNAVCSFEGKKGRVRAIRALEEGEELTICYLERGKPTPQRRQALKEHFFFTCSCSACLSFPSPMDMKMTALSCPRCSKEAHRKNGKEGLGYVCTQCIHFMEESEAKERILNILGKYTKEGSPFDAESYDFREGTLDFLFDNYEKLKKVVGKNNIIRFEIERNLIDRSIEEARWIDALNAAKDQTHSLLEYYGQYWPIVGLHYFRMGKIQKIFADHNAGPSLEKACEILAVTHGNEHPLVQEGLNNLVQVKMMGDFSQIPQLT